MLYTKALAAFVAAISIVGTAQAYTATVNTTLDLSKAGFATSGFTYTSGSAAYSSFPSFALAAGDVLDYTIDFKGSQSLSLTNANLIWGFIFSGNPTTAVTGTGSLELLDAGGSALLTSLIKTDSEGDVHFGQQFDASDFASFPMTVTFWGLHYVGTLDAYDDGVTTTRDYVSPGMALDAEVITANVPEPASWALMIGGFGLVGGALRRRRFVAA